MDLVLGPIPGAKITQTDTAKRMLCKSVTYRLPKTFRTGGFNDKKSVMLFGSKASPVDQGSSFF